MHGFFVETQTEQNRFDLVFFDPAVFIGLEHAAGFFVNRGVRKVQVLLQVTQRVFLGNVDGTSVDAFLAENHLEKGGFTATIAAHKPHAFVVAYKHRGAVKQHLLTKRLRNVLNLNHGVKFRKSRQLAEFSWLLIKLDLKIFVIHFLFFIVYLGTR